MSGDPGDDEGTSPGERLLMAVSVAFTLLLFAFALWQGVTTPTAAEPTASVAGTETLPDGDVRVAVVLRNAQDTGLVLATVEVDCGTPPPELTFEHVPADDVRTGHVRCPPGTEAPNATVSAWTEA